MKRALHTLRISHGLAALIRGLHPHLKRKVRAALEQILANPLTGKALKDNLAGLRSYRLGRFRVIYRVSARRIEIVAFGPRERIYEDTYRLVARSKDSEFAEEPRGRYRIGRVQKPREKRRPRGSA